jgi:hypothetical protein
MPQYNVQFIGCGGITDGKIKTWFPVVLPFVIGYRNVFFKNIHLATTCQYQANSQWKYKK